MGRHAKPTPEKYCEHCLKQLVRNREKDGDLESLLHFGKRKYCDRACMSASFVGRYKDDPLPHQGRWRARRITPEAPCTSCGCEVNVDVHHIDEDPLNNTPENLLRLCRRCHYWTHHQPRLCSQAGCTKKHKARGLCDMHYQREKKRVF